MQPANRNGGKVVISVGIVLAILVVLGSVHTYFVDANCSGDLLWNHHTAYLFIGVGRLGYKLNYLEYPIQVIRDYFGISRKNEATRFSTVVLQLTPSTVQTYELNGESLDFYTPFHEDIYANRQGTLWKWAGGNFVEASEEESRQFGGTNHLSSLPFTNVNGWTARYQVMNRPAASAKFELDLGGKPLNVVIQRNDKTRGVSVDIIRRRPTT
jgi:hypothetical protein